LAAEEKAIADLTPLEREELLDGLQAEQDAMKGELKTFTEVEDLFGADSEFLITSEAEIEGQMLKIENAIAAVEDLEAAEASAVAAAAKVTTFTKVSFVEPSQLGGDC
jgi:hypothetical protein